MASEWTIDTLLEHIRAIADERQEALGLLAADLNKRFESTNEWRNALNSVLTTLMPRHESEEKFSLLQGQVSAIQQSPFVPRDSLDTVAGSLQREITDLRHFIDTAISDRIKVTGSIESDVRALREGFADFKANADQRFHSVNEFRSAMGDQQKTYLPKTTWDTGHEFLRSQVEATRLGLVEHQGLDLQWQAELRAQIGSLQAKFIGAAAALSAVAAVLVALVAILRINA